MGITLNETAASFARLFGSAMISFPVLLLMRVDPLMSNSEKQR